MTTHYTVILAACSVFFGPIAAGYCENAPLTPQGLVKNISRKYGNAREYAFEGRLEISRRIGEKQKEVLANAKVSLAAAAGGKYRIQVENDDRSQYLLVSDGQQAWTYLSALNQYMERKIDGEPAAPRIEALLEAGQSPNRQGMIAECARFVAPMLAGLAQTAQSSFITGSVLTVVSKKDAREHQTMAYLTIDAATLAVSRISWMSAAPLQGEKLILRLDVDFTNFHVGAPTAAQDFTFVPPPNAKLVESFPASGPPVEAGQAR